MLNNYNDVLTVQDLREILHVGKNLIYTLLSTGEIPSRRIGRKYIIPKNGLIDFLEEPCRTKP